MADEFVSIFAQYPCASWTVEGKDEILFSVRRIRHTGGNRLAPHTRLHRDGAKHDDMGCEPPGYELTIVVMNGNLEDDVPYDSYPDAANALIESFAIHEVGDLVVPTIGKRRCRLATFDRVEDKSQEGEDCALIVARWTEDNEDDAAQAAFQAPSASSASREQAEGCSDAYDDSGPSLGETLSDLKDAAGDVQDMANAPGEFVSDIETQANSVMNTADRLSETVSNAGATYTEEIANLFTDPAATVPGRLLNKLEDTVRRAVLNKVPSPFSRIVEKRYPVRVSIFDVAKDVQQDSIQLMALNGKLEDVRSIAPNTPVKVYAS